MDPPAGAAALEVACFAGHAAVVELLLADARLDLSAKMRVTQTYPSTVTSACLLSLTAAAEQGHVPIVERLLADPRVVAAAGEEALAPFRTGLRVATEWDRLRTAWDRWSQAVFSHIATYHVRTYATPSLEQRHPSYGPLSTWTRDHLRTALFNAASDGNAAHLRELLAQPLLDPQDVSFEFSGDACED